MIVRFRSILSVLLCGVLALSPLAVSADSAASGYTAITSKADLDAIRQNPAGRYRLTADIAFSKADFAPGGVFYNNGAGWRPIGNTYSGRFTGELDGNGHTISGLSVVMEQAAESAYAGLFGYASGRIHHLRMADTTITVTGGQYVYAGTIVAAGMGTIQSCSVENSRITATDIAVTGKIGGIAGRMFSGQISACEASGIIETQGVAPSAGGIVGQSHATVEQAYSHMSITLQSRGDSYIGGLAGINEETIRHSLSDSKLEINSQADGYTGGIAGWNQKTIANVLTVGPQLRKVLHYDNYGGVCGVNDGTVTASYYTASSCPDSPSMSGVTAVTSEQAVSPATFVGWDFDRVWCTGLLEDILHPVPQAIVSQRLRRAIDKALDDVPDSIRYTTASLQALQQAATSAWSITDDTTAPECFAILQTLTKARTQLVEKTLSCATKGNGHVEITGENRYGASVMLTATADADHVFSGFTVNRRFYPNASLHVTVSGQENATAHFRSSTACTIVFRSKYGRVLDVQTITSASEIKSPQAETLPGYTFVGWNTDLAELDLSAGCIQIDAVYEKAEQSTGYTLTLMDATTEQALDQPLAFDTRVEIVPAAKDDQVFSHWLVNGSVAGSDPTYVLYVAGNDTVQAVYGQTTAAEQPVISIQPQFTLNQMENGRYTLSVIGMVYTPADTQVVEYGVLFGADSRCQSDPETFAVGNMRYATQTITASSVQPNRRYLIHLRQIPAATTRYARAYMVVQSKGQRQILYSPVMSIIIPQ